MSDKLARRYEILLRAYPARHRRQWGDELLGTLLMRADSSRRWPPAGEAIALLTSGVRVRLNSDKDRAPRATWAAGLRVAVILLLASQLADLIILTTLDGLVYRAGLAKLAFGVLALLAILRDRRWVALLALLGWQAIYLQGYHSVSLPVATEIILLVVVALIQRTHRAVLPGLWWLAVPAMMAIFWGPQLLSSEPVFPPHYEQVMTLTVVALCAVATLLDSRAAFAAVGLLLAKVLTDTVSITWAGDIPAGGIFYHAPSSWNTVMGTAAAALLIGGHLVTRRRASL
ncbi:hypothetical protein [Micromonospora sp. SL4-19]|uniref:hypothetical protein n=1 Tax=Micromonospora sp. SL4-19 TaxID=3399129 RepID=UPI003A4DA3C7